MSKATEAIKSLITRRDNLVIESCPLHTEKPEWAAHAPAQVEAALKRGAHVIGFTELGRDKKLLVQTLTAMAKRHGYVFYQDKGETAIAYKAKLVNAKASSALDAGIKGHCEVKFDFHGQTVVVKSCHWSTIKSDPSGDMRHNQSQALISQMHEIHRGGMLSFFVADSNPHPGLHISTSVPRRELERAGIVLVYTELHHWPKDIGVTTIGRNIKDLGVKAVRAVVHPTLGSDHHPVTATYSIKRP